MPVAVFAPVPARLKLFGAANGWFVPPVRQGHTCIDRHHIRRAIEGSLRRLKTDYVDLDYAGSSGGTRTYRTPEGPVSPLTDFSLTIREREVVGLVGDAATGYRVYHSADGRGFSDAIETTETSLVLTGLEPRSLHFFRVTATNQGGESFPSPVVAVRTPIPGGSAPARIVDGSDRLDSAALIPQWESSALGTAQRMFLERMNRYDYAVEHGSALATCSLAFDGAVNEAVEAGDLLLSSYQLVDWFSGEDAAADAGLSERDSDHIRSLASTADGVASLVSYHDAHEVFARASLVRNTVEPDPNAPTLTEVREIIDEVMAEEPEEEEKDL